MRIISRHILTIFLLCITINVTSAKNSAEKVTVAAIEKINSAPSIKSEFTAKSGSNTTKGSITISKNRFIITSSEATTWYDGKDLWVLSTATNEVNLSEPTPEELAEINPLSFISTLRSNFSGRLLKSPQGTDCVEYTPKTPGKYNISKVVVTFNSATNFPIKLVMTVDGRIITVNVDKFQQGKTLPASEFKFNQSRYPGAEIIDLR